MIDLQSAHTQLVTRHNTLAYETPVARLSLRKKSGRYYLTLHDKTYAKVSKKDYATLPGVVDAANVLVEHYL